MRGRELFALALVTGAAACTGSAPHFEDGTYRHGQVHFRLTTPVPADWRRIDVDAASLAWRDEAHAASVLINARCGGKDDDTPLPALVNHLMLGTTEREVQSEETVPFDGREARHVRLVAKLDGVPRAYDLYVAKKDGCVYDFVYLAAPERIEAGVADFERVVRGFHTS